jgi:Rrf2 family protein
MASRHFFRVSEAVALALHSTSILAEYDGGKLLSNQDLAKMQKASKNHLSKVLQRLVRVGIVSSTRGPGGGFKLAKAPDKITLLEVYEAIEGHMEASGCLFEKPVCTGTVCLLGNLISDLEKQTRDYLGKTTMKDVVKTFHIDLPED